MVKLVGLIKLLEAIGFLLLIQLVHIMASSDLLCCSAHASQLECVVCLRDVGNRCVWLFVYVVSASSVVVDSCLILVIKSQVFVNVTVDD